MRKQPIRAKRNQSAQRVMDRESFHTPEGILMMEDLLEALKADQLPSQEVKTFFVKALTTILKEMPQAELTSDRGKLLIGAFELARKRGRSDPPSSKDIDMAIDRYNGMTVEKVAEAYAVSDKTVTRVCKRIDKFNVPVLAKCRAHRELEVQLLQDAIQNIKLHEGQKTGSDGVVLTAIPSDEIPDVDLTDPNIHRHGIALIQACVQYDGEPVPADILSHSYKDLRLEILKNLGTAFVN